MAPAVPDETESLAQPLRAALARHRSADDVFDVTCAVLRHHLGPEALISIYVAAEGRSWLRAQRGYAYVIDSLGLDSGNMARAVRDGRTIAVLSSAARESAYVGALEGVESEIAVPFAAGALQGCVNLESTERLDPSIVAPLEAAVAELEAALARLPAAERRRATAPGPLARAFTRIAAMRDSHALLELTARTLGEMLGLDCVEVLEEQTGEDLRLVATWHRRRDRSLRLGEELCRTLARDSSFEPFRAEPARGAASRVITRLASRDVAAMVGLPLRSSGELRGFVIGTARTSLAGDADAWEQAELVAAHAATVLENVRAYQRKEQEAATDGLTGLWNHRRFHEAAAELIAAPAVGSFALVIADLDDFKELNDARGHVAGDDALRELAGVLERGVRTRDTVYRIGGEEFALLLPSTTRTNARTVCRRLQRALAARDFDGWRLTLSFGIACWPGDGASLRDLHSAADAALYEAKRLGKDRITLADERLIARRSPTMAARTRRSFEQMRRLQDLVRRLAGQRTPAAVAQVALEALADPIPYDEGCIWPLVGRGLGSPVATRGVEVPEESLAELAREASTSGRPRLRDEDAGDGRGLSALAAPLVGEHGTVGAIVLAARRPGSLDRDDQRLLEVVAHVAGLAFENAALLESVRAEEARSQELLALGRRLAGCETPEQVAAIVTGAAAAHVTSDRASLWLTGGDDRLILHGASGALAADLLARGPYVSINRDGTVDQRLEAGETVTCPPHAFRGIDGYPYPDDATAVYAPLTHEEEPLGLLVIVRLHGPPFAPDEVATVEGIAGQAALALRAQRSFAEVESGFLATIDSLVHALEAVDAYTSRHASAVVDLASRVGFRLGLEPAAVRDIEHAAALHDIGKIGVPGEVLRKAAMLDSREVALMRRHPELGAQILEPVERLRRVAPLVRHSHERWDGGGYPDGLAGDDIPLGARVVAVCDAYHAMVSERPYRGAIPVDDALDELRQAAGSQFDPAVVEAFLDVVGDQGPRSVDAA